MNPSEGLGLLADPDETKVSSAPYFKNPAKRLKGNAAISMVVRRAIWDIHIGAAIKRAKCPICGIAPIEQNANSGYDAAHIVPDKYFTGVMSIYYCIPSCKACNNNCGDLCILDYLYVLNRLEALRHIIHVIYKTFISEHDDELAPEARTAYGILDKLYGPQRFILGGIQNTKQIYEIARTVQYNDLLEESRQLAAKQLAVATQMQTLLEYQIKPMKFQ